MGELPVLGRQIAPLLQQLALSSMGPENMYRQAELVESICALLIQELRRQGLATSDESFMTAQGEQIQASIENQTLRTLPTQYEI
jgi:hypothetical protein